MATEVFLPLITFGTIIAVAIFGYVSAVKTEERRQANTRKSTLAADAPSTTPPGVKPVDT
jgi:hypothetical protein